MGPGGVRPRRERDGRALLRHPRWDRVKTLVYVVAGLLASRLRRDTDLVQGQGKADLATGYELDIIASAVVGGASLSGGRGSVLGAVLGTLIFGVLRNALPQIPGATFYDRLIVGLVVVVIVVMDQFIVQERSTDRHGPAALSSACLPALALVACGGTPSPESEARTRARGR